MNPDIFAMVCYLALMQGNGGMVKKSPDYINEKRTMLGAGYNAFAYLDIYNMGAVVNWMDVWKIELPKVVAEAYKREEEAAEKLKAMGIEL